MSLSNYADLTGANGISAWLDHTIFSANYSTFVQLFESEANRRLRVRQQEATAILVPSTPPQIAVTGAVVDGNNQIKLTVTSTATYTTGQEVTVQNVNGTIEANGSWIVTVNDLTHLTLQNSLFSNAYIGGGTVQAIAGIATLPADYLTWRRATLTAGFTAISASDSSTIGTTSRTELSYVHPSYFQGAYPAQPVDVPRVFTIEGSTFKVMPIAGIPVEFDYYQLIPSLQTNSTNWLMSAHPDLYLFGCLVEAEAFGVNDERMPMWKDRVNGIYDQIIRLNNQTRAPSYVRVFGATP